MTTKSTTDELNHQKMAAYNHGKYLLVLKLLRRLWAIIGQDNKQLVDERDPGLAEDIEKAIRL